jgi:hypothetical protein
MEFIITTIEDITVLQLFVVGHKPLSSNIRIGDGNVCSVWTRRSDGRASKFYTNSSITCFRVVVLFSKPG